jgi:hypothetical protein
MSSRLRRDDGLPPEDGRPGRRARSRLRFGDVVVRHRDRCPAPLLDRPRSSGADSQRAFSEGARDDLPRAKRQRHMRRARQEHVGCAERATGLYDHGRLGRLRRRERQRHRHAEWHRLRDPGIWRRQLERNTLGAGLRSGAGTTRDHRRRRPDRDRATPGKDGTRAVHDHGQRRRRWGCPCRLRTALRSTFQRGPDNDRALHGNGQEREHREGDVLRQRPSSETLERREGGRPNLRTVTEGSRRQLSALRSSPRPRIRAPRRRS